MHRKKSSAQLDREIAAALVGRSTHTALTETRGQRSAGTQKQVK